ncbi:MAG: hypothetical protein NTW65_13420 [Deltaproteobacteria bacterium]|nr:hypothetical protein [Deltaproteobacteria bacterium]
MNILQYIRQDKYRYFIYGIIIGTALTFLILPEMRGPFFWALVGAIFSLIVFIAYNWVNNFVNNLFTKSEIIKLLGPIYKDKCVIFITEYFLNAGDLLNYMGVHVRGTKKLMGTGDAGALPYVYVLLMKAKKSYADIEIIKSYKSLEDHYTDNFISVGGLTNRSTKGIMDSYKDKMEYIFSDNGNLIVKNYGKFKKYIMCDREKDYGMILKISNLNSDGKVIFIIAGIGDLGTTGAAYFLSNNIKKIVEEFGFNDFALIVSVKREFGEKSAIREDFDKISREFIEEE